VKVRWPKRLVDDVVEDVTSRYPVTSEAPSLLVLTERESIGHDGGGRPTTHRMAEIEPCVAFGDVSCSFQYVDRPFVRGVDALKVLRARAGVLPRYLYHALRGVELPRVGYARHWKYLRRSVISLPPLSDQRRIADALDCVDRLRAGWQRIAARGDMLRRQAFLAVCGDPVRNPMDWPTKSFDEVLEDVSRLVAFVPRSATNDRGRYPVIGQGLSEIEGYVDDGRLVYGDRLPLIFFGDHSRTVRVVREPSGAAAGGVRVLAARDGVSIGYLAALLRAYPIPDLGYARHMRLVKRIDFIVPPRDTQRRVEQIMDGIEKTLASAVKGRSQLKACETAIRSEWL
jgi:hypothetical protein